MDISLNFQAYYKLDVGDNLKMRQSFSFPGYDNRYRVPRLLNRIWIRIILRSWIRFHIRVKNWIRSALQSKFRSFGGLK
jgi:hypothetical protein